MPNKTRTFEQVQKPTTRQFRQLHQQLAPRLAYLGRLRDRLCRRGYTMADPYMVAVVNAYNATHELLVATHYEGCEGGVAKGDQSTGPGSSGGKFPV